MVIVENAGVDLGMSMGSFEEAAVAAVASQDSGHHINNDQDQPKNNNQHLRSVIVENNNVPVLVGPHDPTLYMKVHPLQAPPPPAYLSTKPHQVVVVPDHLDPLSAHRHRSNNGEDLPRSGSDVDESYKRNMAELEEMFSKLNPMAEEFVPLSLSQNGPFFTNNSHFSFRNGDINGLMGRRKSNYSQGKRRINSRTSMAQREDIIKRTVYVSDIDHQITEEQLAGLFLSCGQVVDCRVCGDPNSVLRFAFIEFTDKEGARAALNLAGTMLGYYPVRVLPSKTAIAPVNSTFLPRSDDEREMCARTIYCTNLDKKVSQSEVKLFFESVCGEVYRLRLFGDYHHSTRIAFVEFVMAESAVAALNCSGVVLGSLPIRISPSKTPVRPRAPRLPIH